jgi:transcriptional regulator with XRE-family HTH domain
LSVESVVFTPGESPGVTLRPQDRFSENLRRARTKAGLSQEELGRLCDLHRTEISLLERAGREPRLGTITKLASAIGVAPATLLAGIAWSPEKQVYEVEPQPSED